MKRDGITQRDAFTVSVTELQTQSDGIYIKRDGITPRDGIAESVTELQTQRDGIT